MALVEDNGGEALGKNSLAMDAIEWDVQGGRTLG
jgi:hypothetical protein